MGDTRQNGINHCPIKHICRNVELKATTDSNEIGQNNKSIPAVKAFFREITVKTVYG